MLELATISDISDVYCEVTLYKFTKDLNISSDQEGNTTFRRMSYSIKICSFGRHNGVKL